MSGSELALPRWARVSEKRRAHITRVTTLLDEWAARMTLDAATAQLWHDAGRLHDALRDAPEDELRRLAGDVPGFTVDMLHGPAAAARLRGEGESRVALLDAIRLHTVGSSDWQPVGRALYMADFLEPGRKFMQADRAFLAERVPDAFDAVFRQVVRMRIEWVLREGKGMSAETVDLWNSVR